MSATVTERPAGPRPTSVRRPGVLHAVLAVGLALVAGLRAAEGDWLWAGVLGVGAVAEAVVWTTERRRWARAQAPAPGRQGGPDLPERDELAVAHARHARTTRMWTVLVALTLVVALALLTTDPALAAVVGLLGLAALLLRRRSAATTARLSALRGTDSRPDRRDDPLP